MTKVLYVTSSPRGQASYSNQVATRVLDEIRRREPGAEVTVRDLASHPLPHIDGDFVSATRSPSGPSTDSQRESLARSDALVVELLDADIIVIASAMINFGIPSTLKTWVDNIARAGRTFVYSESGAQGLLTGKQAIIVVASGGVYAEANQALDFQLPYIHGILSFLGVTDVATFRVEGTAFGPDAASTAVAEATRKIRRHFAEAA